jgi:hypothetical protein
MRMLEGEGKPGWIPTRVATRILPGSWGSRVWLLQGGRVLGHATLLVPCAWLPNRDRMFYCEC